MTSAVKHPRRQLAILAAVVLLGLPGWAVAAQRDADPVIDFVVASAATPAGAENLGVQWLRVQAPSFGERLLAVAKPQGRGRFRRFFCCTGLTASRASTCRWRRAWPVKACSPLRPAGSGAARAAASDSSRRSDVRTPRRCRRT